LDTLNFSHTLNNDLICIPYPYTEVHATNSFITMTSLTRNCSNCRR